jgi:hypothetical protein
MEEHPRPRQAWSAARSSFDLRGVPGGLLQGLDDHPLHVIVAHLARGPPDAVRPANPSRPAAMNRERHLPTVRGVTPSSRATSRFGRLRQSATRFASARRGPVTSSVAWPIVEGSLVAPGSPRAGRARVGDQFVQTSVSPLELRRLSTRRQEVGIRARTPSLPMWSQSVNPGF